MTYKKGVLSFDATGDADLGYVVEYLSNLNDSYGRICFLSHLTEAEYWQNKSKFIDRPELFENVSLESFEDQYYEFLYGFRYRENSRRSRSFEWHPYLVLHKARFSSPGFWGFLGALNPLETLRHYIIDRHERKKDRLWRNKSEERRAQLENLHLQFDLIRKITEYSAEIGIEDQEPTRRLISGFIGRAIAALDEPMNRGFLSNPSVKPLPSDDSK